MIRAARLALSLALFALLAACASRAAFDQRMATFVGRTEGELIAALGVPQGIYEPPGGPRFLQYERFGSGSPVSVVPSIGIGYGSGGWGSGWGIGTGIGFGFGGYAPPVSSCTVIFELRDGRVARFESRGEGCVARPA